MGLLLELVVRSIDKFLAATNLYKLVFACRPDNVPKPADIAFTLPTELSPELQREIENWLYKDKYSFFDREWNQSEYRNRFGQIFTDRYWWQLDLSALSEDPKYTWELNRHQHLPLLALSLHYPEYARDADERLRSELKTWLKENPPERGLNWASNLEVALRSISWCLAFWMAEPKLDEFWVEFLATLRYHGNHLERHLPYTRACIPNNHLLGESVALVILGLMFNEKRWISYESLLCKLVNRQFYEDGVNFEQSINYHRFSLQFILLIAELMMKFGRPVSTVLNDRLNKGMEFLSWVQKPDGSCPNIGDSDNANVVIISRDPYEVIDSVLGLRSLPISSESQAKFKAFPIGGYYIWRSNWSREASYLLIKAGPHKFHAHADLLHLEYSYLGENILVDSGTGQYNLKPTQRRYFRSTPAHNTVTIEGKDQSMQFKTFRWLRRAKTVEPCFFAPANQDFSTIFKSRVKFAEGKYQHIRRVQATEDLACITIADLMIGAHKVQAHFHLDPTVEACFTGSHKLILKTQQGRELVMEFKGQGIEVKLESRPFSQRYGEIEEHLTIAVYLSGVAKKLCLETHIYPI